jgi:glutamyl-tRNA synthetase
MDEQSEIRAVLAAQLKGPDVPPEKAAKMIEVAASEIMRWALMGSDPAPPNKQVMEFLGKEECLKRIRVAANVARKAANRPDWQPEGFDWVEVSSAS